MEREKIENPLKEEHKNDSIDCLEENKNCGRNESLFGLTRGKLCESCENFEKSTPLGQSRRRCQACARIKNSLEKKPFHEELERDERLKTDYEVKDEPMVVTTPKFVTEMNTNLGENWNACIKDSHNEIFAVEHEQVDLLGANVAEVPNFTNNEDGKVISRKKESVFLNRKEYNTLYENESTSKKEKIGYPKGKFLLDKDIIMSNERKEQTIDILDAQKIKEELELERRERGWIINGSIIGKNASHSKVSPMKSVVTTDGYFPGNEQKERIKVKTLKEKLDTQRILGLVAKRSESRINSPIHRNPNPNHKRNEVETPHIINIKNNVVPSITLHEKNLQTSKLQGTNHEMTTNGESGSNYDEIKRKSFHTTIEEVSKSQFHTPQEDSKSKCSLPTNLGCYSNENILVGTQRILELLAKRNGSRVTSPTQSLEINTHESESNNITYGEPREQSKTKKSDFTFQSSKLHDQQEENLVELPHTTINAYKEHDLMHENINGKQSDSNYKKSSNGQIYKAQQKSEHNNVSLTNASCHFNDNQFNNTHQVLGLIAQRSENNIMSPKKCTYFNSKDESLSNVKRDKPNIVKVTSEVVPSYSKENQEATLPKVTHLTSTLSDQNKIYKKSEGTMETTMHLDEDSKTLETKYEEILSRPNSPKLKFSTPSSTICHVNDNPLYGTKFESEPTSCISNNTNESHLHTSNPSISLLVAHNSFDKPLKNTSNEALETNTEEISSTFFLKNSSIYNSLDMTPLYKSAIATPVCKSLEPIKEINRKNYLQIESRYHAKDIVEIVEEKKKLTLKNRRIEELNTKYFDKNDERCEEENDSTLEVIHLINESTRDLSNKEYCKEKINFNCNPKVSSCKNIFKSQFILWPIQIVFGVLTYPFQLVLKSILFLFYLFKFIYFGIVKAFKKFKNITMMGIGNQKSKILENFQSGCNNAQRYSCCGCVSKTYILVVFSSLILHSLFDLDFYLVNRFIEGQVIIREALNFDYTKEHPTAMVNLLPQQIMGKAKGYFPDKEVMTAHAFPPSYIFHMIVHLTLPESQHNQEIGMFQIVIETFSARSYSLNKASRASMLRYHSPPVKYMKSIIMGIPIILGLYQESQTLSIQMLESQAENEHSPTATVCIEIEPKIGHLSGLGVPEIYHAELQVIAHNPYLKEVARNWVWNIYVFSGLALFIFEVLLVLCCCQRVFLQKIGSKRKSEEFLSKNKKTIFERGQKIVQAPRRLHKGHIYYSKNLPLALPNMSNVNDSRNTLSCNKANLEEFKVIRLVDNSIPKSNCKLSF